MQNVRTEGAAKAMLKKVIRKLYKIVNQPDYNKTDGFCRGTACPRGEGPSSLARFNREDSVSILPICMCCDSNQIPPLADGTNVLLPGSGGADSAFLLSSFASSHWNVAVDGHSTIPDATLLEWTAGIESVVAKDVLLDDSVPVRKFDDQGSH
jgi:hypothetical protein